MSIIIESRRKKATTLQKQYPDALLLDVTSKAEAQNSPPPSGRQQGYRLTDLIKSVSKGHTK